jgi:hypothetical protein
MGCILVFPGLDLGDASSSLMSTSTDAARTAFSLRPLVLRLQVDIYHRIYNYCTIT